MSPLRYCCLYIILYILSSLPAFSQTRRIDDLKKNALTAKTDEEKLQATLALCNQGYTLNPDTLMVYAIQAENLAKKQGDLRDEVKAKYYRAYALTNKGLIDSSLAIADQCLASLLGKVADPVLEANLLNQKGRCYMRKNQYKEAIDVGYQVIRKAEIGNDTLLQMQGKTLIGWAYLEMGQTKRSLYWHLQALNTTPDTLFVKKYGILFANIALNYNALGNKDSAFYYIKRAVEYSRMYENLFALSNSLAIQAQLLIGADKASLAETSLKEVIEIRKMIGDPFYIVSDMGQLGLYYAHNGQPEKGIAICNEGLEIANKYKIDTKLFFLYTALAENYKVAGNLPQYAVVLERLILLKDSVYKMNSEEALADLQAKYEVQKKETTIIKQKLDLTKKNYWLYGSLIVMLLAAVAAYFIFKNYQRKQQIQLLLMLEKEKRISEKAVLDAEENERKRIAADLHDNLGAYAASIASNIDQIKISPAEKSNISAMQELRNNSQSIVSQLNDTIWVLKKDALSLTAISDRLKIFIQRIQSSYPDVKIDVFENILTDHLLPPSQAFHLFQVLQEAVNNALRHSNGKQISVTIESNHSWKITVADDGKGFATGMNKEGNGLTNMKNRSREAGWTIEWLPDTPSGTKVVISPTTN
jgi:signal transduction histidine kinase